MKSIHLFPNLKILKLGLSDLAVSWYLWESQICPNLTPEEEKVNISFWGEDQFVIPELKTFEFFKGAIS